MCPCGSIWKDSIPIRRGSYKESDKKWENVEFVKLDVEIRRKLAEDAKRG